MACAHDPRRHASRGARRCAGSVPRGHRIPEGQGAERNTETAADARAGDDTEGLAITAA
jgi:hypothetical protein